MTKVRERGITEVVEAIAAMYEDEELTVVFDEDEQTAYDWVENTVIIGDDFDDTTWIPSFVDHIAEVHKCQYAYMISPALWTLLHEIGHHFTINEVEENEEELAIRAFLSVAEPSKQIAYRYYNLSTEFAATEWACEFVENYFVECLEFDRKVGES